MQNIDLQEVRDILKEVALAQKENERRWKETDECWKETDERWKETDAKWKETDERIKEAFQLFESQWGKLIESLVEGDLIILLRNRGIEVIETSTRRKGKRNGHDYEFDIIAHNGTEIVIVEAYTKFNL